MRSLRNRWRVLPFAVLALAAAAPACAWRAKANDDPYVVARALAERLRKASASMAASPDSLWDQPSPRAGLVADNRAFRQGDIVRVVISEATEGKHSAQTEIAKQAQGDYKIPSLFGLEQSWKGKPNPAFDLSNLVSYTTDKGFKGDGTTSRKNEMSAIVSCRVVAVLANGDLVLAGSKDVTVNRETQSLWLAGVARPADVSNFNSVLSSSLGDLDLFLGGRGDVSEANRQGWLARFLDRVMPF